MTLDRSFVGVVCPPTVPHLVLPEEIRAFAEAVGEDHEVAPPTFAITLSMRADEQVVRDPRLGLDYRRVLHREQRFVHHRPIRAGDELTVVVTVVEVRAVRGNDILVTRDKIATTAGEEVCTSTTTLLVRGARELRPSAEVRGPGARRVHRADLVRYADASGDYNPIHLDPLAAKACGLPTVVAHGMLTMGLALREVTREIGPEAVASCSAVFTNPIPVPDEVGADLDVERTGHDPVRITVRSGGQQAAKVTAVLRGSNGVRAVL